MNELLGKVSIKWKIGGVMVGFSILIGIVLLIFVWINVGNYLEDELIQRGIAMAAAAADRSADPMLMNDMVELEGIAEDAAKPDEIVYVFMQNNNGELVAHSTEGFSEELPDQNPLPEGQESHVEIINSNGISVSDIAVPILDGMAGQIHLGMSRNYIDKRVSSITTTLILIIVFGKLIYIFLAVFVIKSITSPILKLSEAAEKISMGDVDYVIDVKSKDEIGELAGALDRMRSGLKSAVARLQQEKS